MAELEAKVATDELTGLYNYRYLMLALGQEIERVRRNGGEFSLLMIDFDDFKKLNDEQGHEFGNLVLRSTGTLFRESLRKLDVPCRYGGEEFAIVLPGTSLQEAVELAQRLRTSVENFSLTSAGRHVPVSISIGVDCFRPYEQVSAEQFLDRTDQYLLQAKKSGKNRVCHAPLAEQSATMSLEEKAALMDSFKDRKS